MIEKIHEICLHPLLFPKIVFVSADIKINLEQIFCPTKFKGTLRKRYDFDRKLSLTSYTLLTSEHVKIDEIRIQLKNYT